MPFHKAFGLEYVDSDGLRKVPAVIHRAPLGTHERFVGFLIEHYAGAFPLWLAPVQVIVLPITDRINEYAEKVASDLRQAGFRVESNTISDKIGAKIRDAQMQKIPYMLVLGDQELENGTVAVRERKQGDIGAMTLAEFTERIKAEKSSRSL